MKNGFQLLLVFSALLFFIFSLTYIPKQIDDQSSHPGQPKEDQKSMRFQVGEDTYCSVSPHPYPSDMEQPDGTIFQARMVEEDNIIYLESLDGYSILKDRTDGFYKYATRGVKGDLFLTGGRVSSIDNRTPGVQRLLEALKTNLRFEGERLVELKESNRLKNLDDPDGGTSAVFPSTGIRKSLLILIDFPDQLQTYSLAEFDNLANLSGYSVNGATGSFKEYYEDISYGLLTINTNVVGWYTALNNRATYGIQDINNRNFSAAVPLIREAVDAAEANGVDFSQYDGDGDGSVDVVEVIHSGRGAEASGEADDIWSHRWALSGEGLSVTYDGVLVNDYIIQSEKYTSTTITNIGVLVHEFGHALGLPDLYDTNGGSRGLGHWCCMAGGTWNNSGKTPAQFSAWCKAELGWTIPTVLSGTGSISNMDYSDSGPDAYRINTPDADEYFLLENRFKTGWDQGISGSGLCIYHIDESRSGNTDETRYKVNLEQADGDEDLNNNTNSGDNGDPFPGSSNQAVFNCTSAPNTNTYNTNSTNINISNIAIASNLVSFDYGFCSTDCSIQGISVSDGPNNFNGSTYDIELTISYSFAPGTGTLNVTVGGVLYQLSITGSPQVLSLTGLAADGDSVDASAVFSDLTSCQVIANNLFIAPFNCNNDNVCDAYDITSFIGGNSVNCNNIGATTETNEPRPNSGSCDTQNKWCENNLNNTVWFKFTAPSSGSIDIDFLTALDLQMAIWEADDCSDILDSAKRLMVAANDDSGTAGGYSPRINNQSCLVPGKTYYVQVDGWNGVTDFFSFVITDPAISCNSAPTTGDGCGSDYTATSTGNGEWLHIMDGNNRVIASVNDKFNDLGAITSNFAINTGIVRLDDNSHPLLDRDWFINVANNNAASIRLYLTNNELADLAAAGGASQLSEMNLSKINGASCNDFNGTEAYLVQSANKTDFDGSNNHMIQFDVAGFSGFFPRGNNVVLPVELVSFTAKAVKSSNLLEWTTVTEYNVDRFIIQKLNEREDKWEDAGSVKAAGFSEQAKKYSWEDKELLPISYYRLKTLDLDDRFDHSDIASVQRKENSLQIVRTYPSPAHTMITTEWIANENGFIQLEVRNLSGQKLYGKEMASDTGINVTQLDVSNYPAGIYILVLKNDNRSVNYKIIVD